MHKQQLNLSLSLSLSLSSTNTINQTSTNTVRHAAHNQIYIILQGNHLKDVRSTGLMNWKSRYIGLL